MATANSRPAWADEPDGDLPGTDPAILADIERALGERGYRLDDTRVVGEATLPASNTATDPGHQPQGAEAGLSASANAPGIVPPSGDAMVPTGSDAPETPATDPVWAPPEGEPQTPPEGPDPGTPTEDEQPGEGELGGTLNILLPSGDTLPISQEQANYLVQLHQWLDSKPPEIKQQWAAIEAGTHQSIPTEEYTAYQSWVMAGRPTATQPAAPAKPQFDPSFMTQEQLDYIETLEAKAATQDVPRSTVPTQPAQPSQADIHALATAQANRQVQTQQALDQSTAAVREKYGLTQEQVSHLSRVTPDLNVIPSIVERHRTRSPLGDVLSEAPLTTVFNEAFEMAMTTDPTLRPIYENYIVQQHMSANSDTLRNVGTKKANAASLATAPSAAVPGTEIDPRKMTQQQRHDAMVAELGEAMAGM